MMGIITSGACFVTPKTSVNEERQVELLEIFKPSIILVERYLLEAVTTVVKRTKKGGHLLSIWILDKDIFDSSPTVLSEELISRSI